MAIESAERQGGGKSGAGSAALGFINWANISAYALNLVVTYVSATGAFGATNGELSRKYQTLVSPASFAFSIWGPIFIWEGIFAVTQMLPQFRDKPVVGAIAPFWWSACFCQAAWSIVFAREWVTVAFLTMLAILVSLLGTLWRANSMHYDSSLEFWLLRAPFSVHTGWIIIASVLSANVEADYRRASPAWLLAVAILSLALVFAISSLFVLALPRPDAVIPLVAAWALFAVTSELREARRLLDPAKHNPVAWDRTVLDAVMTAASLLSLACLVLAGVGLAVRSWRIGAERVPPQAKCNQQTDQIVPYGATSGV